MGFLRKSLGHGRKDTGVVLSNTRLDIFRLYGVTKPTDAQNIKAFFLLSIAGMAILNDLGGDRARHLIDGLVEDTKKLIQPLSIRASELANNGQDLNVLLGAFPKQANVTAVTTVNGLAAFYVLYSLKGEALMREILSNDKGPLGTVGYAAIVVANGVFGAGKSREHFMELSRCLMKFREGLVAAI